ncbi:Stk1 family PASTA domain-containing Ser/Thr kinase [Cellulomonas bogoriensis]|uniref:non-specific serine/threonine protein kinase n=1 Tax=Cellulomonas bogoriensis 69B4 = DSM 16987 TaxID=1386082 RepID=A0A0A0BX74_9CELL|nr:Stk1 family PASTA domain-containing Ser/Thr kinase [Cellulomonas bogoriensis]KGM13018.1 serine/threonine protein kinase [Cellulomonas bogoriensis 69B4 = DSM 16987]
MVDAPRILGGRYEVGELIGRGGMAEVHIGHDTRLGRTVAIKILRSDLARDPSFQARFRREAQAAAALNHPSIVAVYDTGEDVVTEHGGAVAHVPFIVMEYVEGHTVREILRDGSAVPIEEGIEIAAGVLSALEYSHHAGIVHRDIKPANVMLTPTGAVKVMDFGIARAMADAAGTMTQTQAVIGTAQYLSPEQARGEAVDTRSDLYSTGCLLFELLTGRPPFIGDSPVAVAYQHAREVPQAPSAYASDVPEVMDRITMKALAKDRNDRYSTAAEFRSDLESAVRGGHVSAPAVGAMGMAGVPGGDATQVMGAQPGETQVMPWAQTAVTPAQIPPGEEPPTEEEEERPDRRKLIWTLVAVAVVAVVGIIILIALNSDREQPVESVEMPSLVGMTEADARAELEALSLEFARETEADDTVPEGTVIRSDPQGPTEVEVGETVTVVVSQGPDAIDIPDLEGENRDTARDRLQALGLTNIQTTTEDHRSIERDGVIRTEPEAGQSVSPDTEVTLVISTGQVQLPDLSGQSEEEVRQTLNDLGLSFGIDREESRDAEPGTVIRQSPAAGPVAQRSSVSVVLATEAGPDEVSVPDVYNLPQDAAEARMGQNQLNTTVEFAYDDTVQADRVFRTDPGAGASVPEGHTVRLFVSRGPEPGNGDDDGENQGMPWPPRRDR